MRTSVITRFAKNTRSLSTRRGIAAVAATVVLTGGIQILATDSAWACSGPYQANNPTISKEARNRIHNGDPVSDFIAPSPGSLTAGGSAEIGVELANFTEADYEAAAPTLTLRDSSGANHLRLKDVKVEVMRGGSWTKLGIDDGCGGEAIRVDTSPLLQQLPVGRASRTMFRVSLAAGVPEDLTSLSVTTSAWAELQGPDKPVTRTVKVVHAGTKPSDPATKKPAPAKPAPAKPAADETKTATPTAPAAEAPKSPEPTAASSAPATTAPAGTPELAHTGASETNTFLAVSAAALLALGAGVLIAVRRLRPQR